MVSEGHVIVMCFLELLIQLCYCNCNLHVVFREFEANKTMFKYSTPLICEKVYLRKLSNDLILGMLALIMYSQAFISFATIPFQD